MQRLSVELGSRSHPVLVGPGLLGDGAAWARHLGVRSLVVTSETVAGLHLDALRSGLGAHPHSVVTVPDGEPAKSLDQVERIITAAIETGLGRDGTFIALGGGAVGDVTGLAAALYHRGTPVIQAPTTLLAQVDSAVGGKTAVDHRLGKNLIGAFHQPRCVVADIATLATLPQRELRAGLAEAIKIAILDGETACARIEADLPRLAAFELEPLEDLVYACCAAKASFVSRDETDRGERALLNFGHSFGHAVEAAYKGRLLHGEAVAIGGVMAASLSRALGWLAPATAGRIEGLFRAAGLPVSLPAPAPSADTLLELMRRDKKNAGGALRLVLLHGLGRAEVTDAFPHAALVLTLREAVEAAA